MWIKQVDHLDKDPKNNDLSNLRVIRVWVEEEPTLPNYPPSLHN